MGDNFFKTEQVVILIWAAVSACLLVRKVSAYRKLCRYVSRLPEGSWEELFAKYRLEGRAFNGLRGCCLARGGKETFPCLTGLWHPCLILPDTVYEKEQMRYILLHEQMHIENKDILRKLLLDILCACFWWNPVFWLLRKTCFSLIEMKADAQITKRFSEKETLDYMECLKDTAMQLSGKAPAFGLSFAGSHFGELKMRMELLADGAFRRWQQLLAVLLFAVLLAVSSSYLLPPYQYAMLQGRVPVTPYTTCLVKCGEAYEVYVNGRYVRMIKDPETFAHVPVYESLEEYHRYRD